MVNSTKKYEKEILSILEKRTNTWFSAQDILTELQKDRIIVELAEIKKQLKELQRKGAIIKDDGIIPFYRAFD